MSVTVAVRFPLGRYHATAWDRSVNEGAVEWPPSPWRFLRALVSTWYTRWPELPAPVLDGLLETLGDPPSYWTAPARPGHTRHYLPDVNHRKGEPGSTDLTLDPFLRLSRDDYHHLLMRWDAELAPEHRGVLAKLVELIAYLGRADSVCEGRLLDTDHQPDETWWRPNQTGAESTRLLAPVRPIRRPILELTTVAVRKGRRTQPQDTTWVAYARTPAEHVGVSPAHRQGPATVTAIRFAVASRAPFKATHGVLLADEFHRVVTRRLDGGRPELLGHAGASTDHRHAHWLPLPSGPGRGAAVDGLLVWAPAGINAEEVGAIIQTRRLSGRRGGRDDGDEGYEAKGFPETTLLLQSVGSVEQLAPELCGPARVWRSATPYLPVRHQKRTTLDEYVVEDVRRELEYRAVRPDVVVSRVSQQEGLSDRWSLEFRRYRARERLRHSRRGIGLTLAFPDEVAGPLLLGQLSHFGYGIFMPETAP